MNLEFASVLEIVSHPLSGRLDRVSRSCGAQNSGKFAVHLYSVVVFGGRSGDLQVCAYLGDGSEHGSTGLRGHDVQLEGLGAVESPIKVRRGVLVTQFAYFALCP